MKNKVSIIVPMLNEEMILKRIKRDEYFKKFSYENEVILIDDYSTDESYFIASSMEQVKIIRNMYFRGYIRSVISGIFNSSNEMVCMIGLDDLLFYHIDNFLNN